MRLWGFKEEVLGRSRKSGLFVGVLTAALRIRRYPAGKCLLRQIDKLLFSLKRQ